mmetsp:Transcript_148023/g.475290  ORF Transcript_148023/g.475290 Transcript_148023/m.475290 type:complete len:584 (-) Transcript_148023:108-1859(-)
MARSASSGSAAAAPKKAARAPSASSASSVRAARKSKGKEKAKAVVEAKEKASKKEKLEKSGKASKEKTKEDSKSKAKDSAKVNGKSKKPKDDKESAAEERAEAKVAKKVPAKEEPGKDKREDKPKAPRGSKSRSRSRAVPQKRRRSKSSSSASAPRRKAKKRKSSSSSSQPARKRRSPSRRRKSRSPSKSRRGGAKKRSKSRRRSRSKSCRARSRSKSCRRSRSKSCRARSRSKSCRKRSPSKRRRSRGRRSRSNRRRSPSRRRDRVKSRSRRRSPSKRAARRPSPARRRSRSGSRICGMRREDIDKAIAQRRAGLGAARAATMPPRPMGGGMGGPVARFSEELWEEPREKTGLKLLGELCQGGKQQWNYMVKDESRRSFAAYLPSPFAQDQCSMFFSAINEGTAWKQPQGSNGPIPRKTAWMVGQGCQCIYGYGGIQVEPQDYPPWMLQILELTMPHCGLMNRAEWPNCCNLNLYENGGMSVGWHSDDERLFQGKFQDIRIISLSLGVTRKFELRINNPEPGQRPVSLMKLGNGDLCTMEGMMQKHFQHRVPNEGNISGARINLTWRWVARHNPQCPASRRR